MPTNVYQHGRARAARQPSAGRRFLCDRRAFLGTGLAAVGAYAVAHQGITWIVGPARAWAAEMQVLEPEIAEALLHMTRAVYPHDFLGDEAYAKVVQDLDADAAEGFEDTSKADLLREGVLQLEEATGGSFVQADPAKQLAALQSIETTPFFQTVRGKAVVSLYNQPDVWKQFGYEGASYDKGGYLYNGFDDLSWLPAPPADASPANMQQG